MSPQLTLLLLLSFRFFELFEKYEGYKTGKLKLKKPEQLQVRRGEAWLWVWRHPLLPTGHVSGWAVGGGGGES